MTDISVALYRKYRPDDFGEVRNQDHIVSVLKGAIKKMMIPHALLFTGSRGTGKTTVARIFAKSIGASDMDIYEIDAASNRGIDDVRELREAVHTLPYESPYKVYIIDEVHMLTKEAFNALLKTLEEPPKHVIFILATTERDKLLSTIISRCQVFEFRAPTKEELRKTVIDIAKKEKFQLDSSGADIVAIAADGSYRDALGILQKVIMASGDRKLTGDEVADIVGAPKSAVLSAMVDSLAKKDLEQGMDALEKARESSVDMKLMHKLLLERIRTVLLIRHAQKRSEPLLAQYDIEERDSLLKYAKDAKSPLNSQLLLRLIEVSEYEGKSYLPGLPLELLMLEHCS